MITILIIAYCVIGYFFHVGILSEYAKDKSDDLKDIPEWLIKTCFILCAIFWPVVILYAVIESYFKKEK